MGQNELLFTFTPIFLFIVLRCLEGWSAAAMTFILVTLSDVSVKVGITYKDEEKSSRVNAAWQVDVNERDRWHGNPVPPPVGG